MGESFGVIFEGSSELKVLCGAIFLLMKVLQTEANNVKVTCVGKLPLCGSWNGAPRKAASFAIFVEGSPHQFVLGGQLAQRSVGAKHRIHVCVSAVVSSSVSEKSF